MTQTRAICLALAICLCMPALAQASEPARYTLKQAQPDTGTHIPKNIVESSTLPLNKTYAELTPAQQAALRGQYVGMTETDEPPFPAKGLGPIFREVAKGQQKRLARGALVIFVNVDERGVAQSAEVVQSPDRDLSRYVAAVLMQESFKPALCGGTPCAMQFPLRVDLRVR